MGWPASILVAIFSAGVGAVVAGYAANLAVGWYRISSFEGASGYFVVLMGVSGLVGGLVIGLVASRLVAAGANPGMLRAIGISQLATLGAIAVIGGWARLMADVPPRLAGDTLLLAVEFRWPPGQPLPEPDDPTQWFLRLGSASGRIVRTSVMGPLWREDARLEDDHWVVPGAVEVFTARGERTLDVVNNDVVEQGFIVPLPSRPGTRQLEWSEWLPRAPRNAALLPEGVRFRFRVVPRSQPIRVDQHGPFEIVTSVRSFSRYIYERGGVTWSADALMEIRHHGRPVIIEGGTDGHAFITAAAALGSTTPALLVLQGTRQGYGSCFIVASEADEVRITRVTTCGPHLPAAPLTNDSAVFEQGRRERPPGRFDRTTFTIAERYLFDDAVLDAATHTALPVSSGREQRVLEYVPPLGVSPDRDSFVRLAFREGTYDDLALQVTSIATGETYQLGIDRSRMRFSKMEQIDPPWLNHYFEWQPAEAGDRLTERREVTPRPHRGVLSIDRSGYREYHVGPALPELRAALIDLLVSEPGAERLAPGDYDFAHDVRIGDEILSVAYDTDKRTVGAWTSRGGDSQLVATVAARLDEALRTGRYDHLFSVPGAANEQ